MLVISKYISYKSVTWIFFYLGFCASEACRCMLVCVCVCIDVLGETLMSWEQTVTLVRVNIPKSALRATGLFSH